jgi:uncharacterized membrane protein YedE/YeeE
MNMLIYGIITGIMFGFFLQKARVLRYDKQLGALRFKDMTIVKFMISAILVGMVGIYMLLDLGLAELSLKSTVLGGNIMGGLIFGVGWGLLGYCPGTAAGALGEGRWDAVWGILGMITGAALFAETYPVLKKTVLTWGDLGKITFPQIFSVNHWFVIIFFWVTGVAVCFWFEKNGL